MFTVIYSQSSTQWNLVVTVFYCSDWESLGIGPWIKISGHLHVVWRVEWGLWYQMCCQYSAGMFELLSGTLACRSKTLLLPTMVIFLTPHTVNSIYVSKPMSPLWSGNHKQLLRLIIINLQNENVGDTGGVFIRNCGKKSPYYLVSHFMDRKYLWMCNSELLVSNSELHRMYLHLFAHSNFSISKNISRDGCASKCAQSWYVKEICNNNIYVKIKIYIY